MCGIAINRLNISTTEFYNLTPIEYDNALFDFEEIATLQYKIKFEVARFQLKHQWNMRNRFIKTPYTKNEQVEQFSWDVENASEPQSLEEMLMNAKSWARRHNAAVDGKNKKKK